MDRHTEDSTEMFFLGWLSFIPAGLAIWALYGLLIMLLGGRNMTYGSGWLQWNYVRWMLAPADALRDLDPYQIDWAFPFLYLPVFFGALGGSSIFSLRTTHRTLYSDRRVRAYTLLFGLGPQCPALFIAYPTDRLTDRFHFWWPAPETYVPASSIWLFQITRIILWFLTPYLLYWLALFMRQLWKKRHGLPPETPPVEKTHLT